MSEVDCPFCGGIMQWSWTHTSFSGGPSFVTYTCDDCASRCKETDMGEVTWHRSGHPLSLGYEAYPRRPGGRQPSTDIREE